MGTYGDPLLGVAGMPPYTLLVDARRPHLLLRRAPCTYGPGARARRCPARERASDTPYPHVRAEQDETSNEKQ